MKKCPSCGAENQDSVTQCGACGREFVVLTAPGAARWRKIAVLNSEVEAERLDVELQNLNIPHVMVSYSDSALDGLYQVGRGWGHVEAEPGNENTICALLDDVRQGKLADQDSQGK